MNLFKKKEENKVPINIEETVSISDEKELILYPALLPTGATYKIVDGKKDIRITKTSTVKECKQGDVVTYTIMIVNVGEDFKLEGIGVNEPCPCGSGLKFKKCCKMKEYQFYFTTMSECEVFEDFEGNTYSEVCIKGLKNGDMISLNYKVSV